MNMIFEGPFRLVGDERYSAGTVQITESFVFFFEFKMSVLPENKTFLVLRRVSTAETLRDILSIIVSFFDRSANLRGST